MVTLFIRRYRHILVFLLKIAVVIGINLFLSLYVIQLTYVDGDSMMPTLQDGNQLVIEKVSNTFQRYDIIVFPYPQDPNKLYIKRIIGLPNEEINIKNGAVWVDGQPLNEPIDFEEIQSLGDQEYPLHIPENTFFVMGDNRNKSIDSRYIDVGFINKNEIKGKAFLRIFPFSEFGFLKSSEGTVKEKQ